MKKEDFTIEGSTALKRAFVEEAGLNTATNKTIYCNYMGNTGSRHVMLGFDRQMPKHFLLPDQYNEALEYVKGFWEEEETFEVGDLVIGWHADVQWKNKPWKIFRISSMWGIKYAWRDNMHNTGIEDIRKATHEEIDKDQKVTL